MELDVVLLILLVMTGLGAGVVDAIAGGGGMITLPVLMATGMSPVEALATNKLQGSFGSFAASVYFIRRKMVDLSRMKLLIVSTFIGAVLGTVLVQQVNTAMLAALMPILLVCVAVYFMCSRSISDSDTDRRVSESVFALVFASAVGFYDGFFGPGAGTFFALAFVTMAGFNMIKATAHTKVLNFTSNLAALIFFAIGGNIIWLAGFIMAAGQLIGGQIGARLVVSKGTRLVRPLVVVVTLIVSAKLFYQQYESGQLSTLFSWVS